VNRPTVSDKVVGPKAFTVLSIRAKMDSGGHPLLRKIWPKLTKPLQKRRFLSIFARSTSAVTPSEKVQLT